MIDSIAIILVSALTKARKSEKFIINPLKMFRLRLISRIAYTSTTFRLRALLRMMFLETLGSEEVEVDHSDLFRDKRVDRL